MSTRARAWRRYRITILSLLTFPLIGGIFGAIVAEGSKLAATSIAGITIGIALVGIMYVSLVSIPRTRRRMISELADQSWEEIATAVDPEKQFPTELIRELMEGLARIYRVPPRKMRASHRFREDLCLAPGLFFDYADQSRFDWAAKMIGNPTHRVPLADCVTVAQFICAVAREITTTRRCGRA